MKSFTSFDGTRIAYHDEGEGPAVILLHGFAVDGLGQYGHLDRLRRPSRRPRRGCARCWGRNRRCPIRRPRGGRA